jgi:hypothetical protein
MILMLLLFSHAMNNPNGFLHLTVIEYPAQMIAIDQGAHSLFGVIDSVLSPDIKDGLDAHAISYRFLSKHSNE